MLYQKGLISYPRTETNEFIEGTDFAGIIQEQCQAGADQGTYAQKLSDGYFREPRAGGDNDNAHPPIHPTKYTQDFEHPDEKKIYEFVVLHFLACCSPDALAAQTDVTINIAGMILKLINLSHKINDHALTYVAVR